MQQEKSDTIYDPNQIFPVPFTLISNVKKSLTSQPIKQPFGYQVYCPISCKKIKIGVSNNKNAVEAMQFNTTSHRRVTAFVNTDIKYLVNGYNPVKKDKKKTSEQYSKIYVEVQDKGNIAIFNPFYVDPEKPLTLYTFASIIKAFKPSKNFTFETKNKGLQNLNNIKLNNKNLFIYETRGGTFISQSDNFEDINDNLITICDPLDSTKILRQNPRELKTAANQHLKYWFDQLNEHFILEQTGISKILQNNIDQIYQQLNYYLNIDEQLRIKLSTNKHKALLNQLFEYHPRAYNTFNRLVSFLNYGNTKFDIFKLAQAGFFNRSDMLQDLAYIQAAHIPIPTAQEILNQTQLQLRSRTLPFARLNRHLPFPNVSYETCLNSISPQTVSRQEIILTEITDHYILFTDKNKKLSVWSGKFTLSKLFQINLLKTVDQNKSVEAIITSESMIKANNKINISADESADNSLLDVGDIFGEQDPKPKVQAKPVPIIPDQLMIEQLLLMGYTLNIVKQALTNVKNQSVPAALDEIQKLLEEEKKVEKKKPKPKGPWSCPACTYLNSAQNPKCQICSTQAEIIDQEQEEKKIKQQIQKLQKQEQAKAEQQRKKSENQQKEQQQRQKKQKQLLQKSSKQQFLKNSILIYSKVFRSKTSSVNPYVVIVVFVDKLTNKSLLKVIRMGYNRVLLASFYRYENNCFVSNFNRNIYKQKEKSIQPINKIITQAWTQIQVINRLISAYNTEQFFVIQQSQIQFGQVLTQVNSDGQNIIVSHHNIQKKYKINFKDDIQTSSFHIIQDEGAFVHDKIQQDQNVKQQSENNVQVLKANGTHELTFKASENTTTVLVEVVEHIPAGKWKELPRHSNKFTIDNKNQGEVSMSEFIPIMIQNYQGSIFSSKYHSTSLFERNNVYISNYPEASFTFKNISGKNMLVQTVTVISNNKRLQKIYPVESGLIFTANQISWFSIAKKKFANFRKKEYEEWLNTKKDRNSYREYWQPVAFFELQTQTQVQIQYKRPAKYLFLLPTSVKTHSQKVDVAALKIDFFGVKGRMEETDQENIYSSNYKNDCEGHSILTIEGDKKDESISIRKKTGINTISYVPTNYEGFINVQTSVSTFYQIKFRNIGKEQTLKIQSQFLNQIAIQEQNKVYQKQIQKAFSITSYKNLLQNFNNLNEIQILQVLQNLQVKQLLLLILQNTKSFRNFQKVLKIVYEIQHLKIRLFNSINELLPQLCDQKYHVSQYGLKSFLRIFQKISVTDNKISFVTLCNTWKNITDYVQRIRNKNYNAVRNKYGIEELILEPQLFSRDYYRLIHPNYIEDQPISTIVQEPKTQMNNIYYVEKQNNWYYRTLIDLRQTKKVDKIDIYFPKIAQVANRFKICLKIFQVSDQSEKLIYYRYFNEEALVQFSTIAYKQKQIYSQPRINYFSVDINTQTRFLRFQYSYLLLTTLNCLKYKEPTESLMLYPIVKTQKLQKIVTKTYNQVQQYIQTAFPKEAKHSSILESLPPVKYSIDRNFSYYEIYEFPVSNPQIISKEFSSIIDKITTNIMDKQIVEQCRKAMKISQYQFDKKGLDFGYTFLINVLKFFKKMPNQWKINVNLLLQMFEIFVIYEIGPMMKKVMNFISEIYKRFSLDEKSSFISHIIITYLSSFSKFKQLKQSQKYSLNKIIEKLQEIELPIELLVNKLQVAYQENNRFLVSMLLKLIRPNIEKFGLNLSSFKNIQEQNKQDDSLKLQKMAHIVFKFNIWVLNNVQNLKIQLMNQGLDLFLILMDGKFQFIENNKVQSTKRFINTTDEQDIWKLVFLTLKLKNEQLNKKVHQIFQLLMKNTTQKFHKSINTMLLQIIKKNQDSNYTKINGSINDDLWMNHLQTILEYLDIESKTGVQTKKIQGNQKTLNKKQFSLDVDTAIQLLNLPLTPVLWAHALLIIPKEDKVLNAIIKNFKKQYYSSLGKQITKFCQPLAGIRSLDSIHINWLDLVRKIRLQGKSIFSLFIEELRKSSFGGKQGVAMATSDEVKQMEITSQFSKLVLQSPLPYQQLKQNIVQQIIVWYFLNVTDVKGESPASEFLRIISQNVLKIIRKLAENAELIPISIKCILSIKKESQKMQGMFKQKRIPTHSALSLNKRFCKCFEDLMNIFVTNDKMSNYFAFEVNGLQYIMQKLNLLKRSDLKSVEKIQIIKQYLPEEQFLLEEKFLAKSTQKNAQPVEIKSVEDLKQQEFGNNVKLVANMNQTATTTSVDWTVYKKGNKTKIIFLPMNDPATYFEYPLYVQLGKTAEVRSIKIGFTSASFQFADKVVVSPSSVVIEGSLDMKSFQPLGQMSYIDDDGYICNGVKVFALNLQKVRKSNKIDQAIKEIEVHRVKYLKIVVKRPLVTFIEGQYSQLNGKNYNSVGVSISFLSVVGDDIAKLPNQLVDSCKQITKKTALNILGTLLTQSNFETMKKISNQETFSKKIKENFIQLKDLMLKYKQTVPQIIYTLGANNKQLGDWFIEQFIRSGTQESQAKIINQIIVSTPNKIYERINYFQKQLFKQISFIRFEAEVQSSLLYTKYVPFMESFCKTLEQCYQVDLGSSQASQLILDCDQQKINSIIDIYDKKYSSPDIKSLLKLLISLIWIKKPLQLSQQVVSNTLDLIWKNCSEDKPYFYNIMSALLVSKVSMNWIRKNNHQKVKSLIAQIDDALLKQNYKALRSQMFLLSILSYHEAEYLRSIDYHITIYNQLKLKSFGDSQIYDYLMKIQQNIVLAHPKEQQKLSALLVQDVSLLVKRKDPILQKLFVGLLAVQQQVMVHLKGADILLSHSNSNKKQESIPSSVLSKVQQKSLNQKIGKKLKYQLLYSCGNSFKWKDSQKIIASLYSGNCLIVFQLKFENKTYNTGFYCPVKAVRKEQDSYYWEEQVLGDKNSFLFTFCDNNLTYFTCQNDAKLFSIYCCDQESDHSMTLYLNNNQAMRLQANSQGTIQVKGDILNDKSKTFFSNAQLYNIEIFQCKSTPSGAASDSKITDILSKLNQAKAPFTWYRHNQIYIFPSQINVKKLEKLLSAKLSIQNISKQAHQKIKLSEIQTQDFVIDANVQSHDDYAGEQDYGYIPKMRIFDSFSKLGGINQVLKLGSSSIKDWKNATRKKNFQHYMEELNSFIHLPNFFSLFIKNHTYVTFLFEVASGMPDDINSTRNWQQEEINSSRFIYKILSDIFKFDKSKQLRDMNKYEDFCQIILEKLSEISKQAPRALKEEEQKQSQETLEVAQKLQKKKTQQQKKKKKKGTGYGVDNQNQVSKWSSTEWLQNKKMRSQQILRVVAIFVSFLDCQAPIEDQRVAQVIKSSCLLPLIQSSLRSSSLLQIAKQGDLFKNYLHIIKNMAKNPSTLGCLLQIQKSYKPQQTQSIHSLLGKLNNIAHIFLQCLKSGKQSADVNDQNTQSLALQIQKTFLSVDKAVRSLQKNKNNFSMKQINDLPIQDAYRMLLQKLRFGYIDLKTGAVFQHALHSSISSASPTTQKILRLSQQLADLSSSLPCEHTNSIFVRCDKSRIDVVKILIMGSKDTPYSNGAFMFDLYCDDSYPNNPPKMVISTTGQGKIRFNPNLYSCGKVCLSLLGTWRGSANENWDPKLSTLLQLLISTQGITMSEDVYFNQPGFDGQQGTQEGDKKNEAYSNIVRLGNIRYAMIQQIKNPPKGFEDVVNRHFYVKRKQIIEQCQKWLQYAEKRQASYSGLVSDHNSSWCTELKASKTKYKQLLQKEVDNLKQILAKLPEPDLKQKNQEEVTYNRSQKKSKRKAKEAELQIDVGYENEKKQQLKIQENVMQDRWSRYIGAMGLQAVKKQSSSNILLLGLKSLGLQVAKNLVLSGLQKLTIIQNQFLESGSEEHFYMSDLKGKRIQQCIFKIKQLNPYMIVNHKQQIPQSLKQYNLVVSTLPLNQSLIISQKCRKQSIKFVYTQTSGVSGNYFADFGQNFAINDINGQQPFEGLIQKITCQTQGIVKLLDGVKHPYEDGDYVVFSKVEGMENIQQQIQEASQAQNFYNKMINQQNKKLTGINGRVFQIKVINWNSFSIGDTTKFPPYVRNGIVKNIKVPKTVKYQSFTDCVKDFDKYLDPNMGIYDFEKMGDNFSIFACFAALSKFTQKNKYKPRNWNLQDSIQFVQFVKQIAVQNKKSEEQIKTIQQFATKFALISQAQLPTIGAYLGGLVAQQIIKGLTNKYTPIKQFFTFHLNELMQTIPALKNNWIDLAVKKEEPFKNIKIVIGQENLTKVQNTRLFIVGAGAIGCQLLKNFAMVNLGSKGKITVTDPDHIQTSNLTRQFLFRQKHVKKPKSATAAAVLMQMNPNLKNHISARLDKVCQETQDIYSDQFFRSQTIIANALDNVKARQYMDKRCVTNKLPLFQSGTLGPKGHVQVIVPYKTQNYGSQQDPNEEVQIPHCTLKMFPEDITHCIQWSRDLFGKIFTLNPKALKKLIDSKDVASLQGKQKSTVIKMIKFRPKTFEDCIDQAVRIFFKYFRNDIRQLLHTYPLDMKTKEGKLFWSLPKRPPVQINKLDPTDEAHQTFISSYSVLFAKVFSIKYPVDFRKAEGKQKIMEHAINVKIEDFIPSAQKSKQLQQMNQKQENAKQKMSQGNEKVQSSAVSEEQNIQLKPQVLQLSILPQQFQKDQDSNGHIDLIYSMSNLRARNYDLGQCKWIDAKLKAGRIMAALSTTTSVVAALQTLQIIKLISGSTLWRNAFVNLAVPLIQITEPGPAAKQKIGNTQFSVWQDWEFKASSLKDLLNQIKQKYQIEGFNVSTAQGTPIFWQTMYKNKQEAQQTLLNKKLSSIVGKQKVSLNILFRDFKGEKIYQKIPKVVVQASQ